MGPSGIDGAFTHAAEATMGVLRKNSDHLLTILSAIVADPLYKWSVSPVAARRRQAVLSVDEDDANDNVRTAASDRISSLLANKNDSINDNLENEGANRALSRIARKLQGYEDGIMAGEMKSIEGQVKLLINAARDPDNLCMLFSGWAPWL